MAQEVCGVLPADRHVVRKRALGRSSWPMESAHNPVTIAADRVARWDQGAFEVLHLQGSCYLNQGLTYARGPEAIVWIERSEQLGGPSRLICYFESPRDQGVSVDFLAASGDANLAPTSTGRNRPRIGQERANRWFARLETNVPLRLHLPDAAGEPEVAPAIYERGLAQFDPNDVANLSWRNTRNLRRLRVAHHPCRRVCVDGAYSPATMPRTNCSGGNCLAASVWRSFRVEFGCSSRVCRRVGYLPSWDRWEWSTFRPIGQWSGRQGRRGARRGRGAVPGDTPGDLHGGQYRVPSG